MKSGFLTILEMEITIPVLFNARKTKTGQEVVSILSTWLVLKKRQEVRIGGQGIHATVNIKVGGGMWVF